MPLMVAQHFMVPAGSGQLRYAAGETRQCNQTCVQINLHSWGQEQQMSTCPVLRVLCILHHLKTGSPGVAADACVAVYGLVSQCCGGLPTIMAKRLLALSLCRMSTLNWYWVSSWAMPLLCQQESRTLGSLTQLPMPGDMRCC